MAYNFTNPGPSERRKIANAFKGNTQNMEFILQPVQPVAEPDSSEEELIFKPAATGDKRKVLSSSSSSSSSSSTSITNRVPIKRGGGSSLFDAETQQLEPFPHELEDELDDDDKTQPMEKLSPVLSESDTEMDDAKT